MSRPAAEPIPSYPSPYPTAFSGPYASWGMGSSMGSMSPYTGISGFYSAGALPFGGHLGPLYPSGGSMPSPSGQESKVPAAASGEVVHSIPAGEAPNPEGHIQEQKQKQDQEQEPEPEPEPGSDPEPEPDQKQAPEQEQEQEQNQEQEQEQEQEEEREQEEPEEAPEENGEKKDHIRRRSFDTPTTPEEQEQEQEQEQEEDDREDYQSIVEEEDEEQIAKEEAEAEAEAKEEEEKKRGRHARRETERYEEPTRKMRTMRRRTSDVADPDEHHEKNEPEANEVEEEEEKEDNADSKRAGRPNRHGSLPYPRRKPPPSPPKKKATTPPPKERKLPRGPPKKTPRERKAEEEEEEEEGEEEKENEQRDEEEEDEEEASARKRDPEELDMEFDEEREKRRMIQAEHDRLDVLLRSRWEAGYRWPKSFKLNRANTTAKRSQLYRADKWLQRKGMEQTALKCTSLAGSLISIVGAQFKRGPFEVSLPIEPAQMQRLIQRSENKRSGFSAILQDPFVDLVTGWAKKPLEDAPTTIVRNVASVGAQKYHSHIEKGRRRRNKVNLPAALLECGKKEDKKASPSPSSPQDSESGSSSSESESEEEENEPVVRSRRTVETKAGPSHTPLPVPLPVPLPRTSHHVSAARSPPASSPHYVSSPTPQRPPPPSGPGPGPGHARAQPLPVSGSPSAGFGYSYGYGYGYGYGYDAASPRTTSTPPHMAMSGSPPVLTSPSGKPGRAFGHPHDPKTGWAAADWPGWKPPQPSKSSHPGWSAKSPPPPHPPTARFSCFFPHTLYLSSFFLSEPFWHARITRVMKPPPLYSIF